MENDTTAERINTTGSLMDLGRDRLEIRMSDSTSDPPKLQAIDLLAVKLKSETVKPALKHVSRFLVLFTKPLVLTIVTSVDCLLQFRNRVID